MSDRLKIGLAGGLVLVAGLVTYLYYGWESSQRLERENSDLAVLELEPDTENADEVRSVEIFLFSPVGKAGDTPLERTTRELPVTGSDILMAQQIINAVIRDSEDLLPPVARVLQAYLLEDGTAVVDLSREVAEQLNGGAASELGVLRSFTRSLRENLPQIRRVRFLVEGEQRPTLSGHVSLRNPFM